MSSRFMPPKVGSIAFTISMIFAGSSVFNSMSNTSMSAKRLNKTPFPSITGFEASAPLLPKPSMAVPLETTATKFPLEVYL